MGATRPLLLLTIVSLVNCRDIGHMLPPDAATVEALANMSFPADAPLGDDLDIIVIRDGSAVTLVNRTARAYHDHYLWLNRLYVAQAPLLRIGTDNRAELSRFVNLHKQTFPVGSLLAPDKARPIVSADLLDPATGKRHRLVVRFADE